MITAYRNLKIATALAATLAASGLGRADTVPTQSASPLDLGKPAWLTDLSFSVKESNDDNVLGVSGLGLQQVSSRVTDLGFKVGLNLANILGTSKDIQTLTLTYSPDFYTYAEARTEDYAAHRLGGVVSAKWDNVSLSFDDAFLYNDGSRWAPTYALNQASGAAANQFDKYRNNYAHSVARERRRQDQDRYNFALKFDEGPVFFRPVSSLTDYVLGTRLENTSKAPYLGYQDYINRYDWNVGSDFGYAILPKVSVFLGYRYGSQFQEQFATTINSDQHQSSNKYQRLLLGVEGKASDWLTFKLAIGPDFREFNADTPISDTKTTRYYGEGSATATISPNQSLSLTYKNWIFVSSTGLVPYIDTTYAATYHIQVSKALGLDFTGKLLEANYTLGNDVAGSAPSLRDDLDYGSAIGLTYAVTKNVVLSVAYNNDIGKNGLQGLAAKYYPDYRDFSHEIVTAGVTLKF